MTSTASTATEAPVVSTAPRFRKGRYEHVAQVSDPGGRALASCTHRHASMRLAEECGSSGVAHQGRTGRWPGGWCAE